MFTKKSIFRIFIVLLVVLMMSGSTLARPLEAPLGTGFTFQGKLTDGGVPANGLYDFEFKLYDDLNFGEQVGSTITQGDVTVTGGLFTVQLDFGDVFDGTTLFLDIGVRPGASVGAYTALTPRQPLSPTPYAIHASKSPWSGLTGVPAGFADGVDDNTVYSAGSGLLLTGGVFNVTGAPWSGLTGVPAGFADGLDDNTTYTAGDGLELVGTQFKGKGTSSQNVVIVAKSGGDFTTIAAALDSITDASASNRYLIFVAPGAYNERVTMKEFVDIEGSGELTTKITFTGSGSATTGTLLGANNAELRFITVENTGSGNLAIAIYNNNASPRLTNITTSASGGTDANCGVYNTNSSSPTMMDVTANASGGTYNVGLFNGTSSSTTMINVTASASGGTDENIGVYNAYASPTMTNITASASGGTSSVGVFNDSSSTTMTDVKASASGGDANSGVFNALSSSPMMTNVIASASGGTRSIGVHNETYSSSTMTNVTASASGGTDENYGVFFNSASAAINNSVINASGGTTNYGIYNGAVSGTYTVLVNNSQISGSTNTILNSINCTTRVGASQLSGGAVIAGGGTVTCAGVYDENFAFFFQHLPVTIR